MEIFPVNKRRASDGGGELFLLFFFSPSHLSAFCKSINPEIWSDFVIKCAKDLLIPSKWKCFLGQVFIPRSVSSLPGSQHPLNAFCSAAAAKKHRWAWKAGPFWVWMEQSTRKDKGLNGENGSAGFQISALLFLVDFNTELSGWAAETLQSNKWLTGERKEEKEQSDKLSYKFGSLCYKSVETCSD